MPEYTCKDCQSPFEFSDGEHAFFAEHGLTDPKRCPSCRATRKGIADQDIICQRCGNTFTYPRELQLYTRSYGWDAPITCFGGCATKTPVDYKQSEFEKKATGVLGNLSRFFGSRSQDKLTEHTLYSVPIKGFENCGSLDAKEAKSLIATLPSNHLSGVTHLAYSGKVLQIKRGVFSRGFYDPERKAIIINKAVDDRYNTKREIQSAIIHELGHAVYDNLSDHLRAEWHTMSNPENPRTTTVRNTWFVFDEDLWEVEDFAEAYRLYRLYPMLLLLEDNAFVEGNAAYYFFKDEIFDGKEYL